jgi:hypothetical protein
MKGESLYKISKLMGHSPEICGRHYAALILGDLGPSVAYAESAYHRSATGNAVTT